MKKLIVFLMVLVLALCLVGCNREFLFPEGGEVLGVDVAGLNGADAYAQLNAAAGNYVLTLNVDGIIIPITAQDIELTCSQEVFLAQIEAMKEDDTAGDFSQAIQYNAEKLQELLLPHVTIEPVEATLIFDEEQQTYVVTEHTDGSRADVAALAEALREAITTLAPEQILEGIVEAVPPTMAADDPKLVSAAETLNKMTGIQLTYTFRDVNAAEEEDSGDDEETQKAGIPHTITGESLRSFVELGEDGLTPTVSQEKVASYVEDLCQLYNKEGSTGSFQTTNGKTVNLTVSYEGIFVDSEALVQEIITSMQEGTSQEKDAPYLPGGVTDMAYGGTYVEIDLTGQKLWFYKNGEEIVSTKLVSGMVGAGWNTPRGVFSIYNKSRDTYLVGDDYRTFVSYWMPFSGGVGLHDAPWRGSFGGDIYLYNGSHGCVNLPPKAAKTIYNNASVGTKVIVYGGVDYMPPLNQSLSGTASYDVADDTKAFKLDVKAKNGEPKMTYSSSNTKVATISAEGLVTITGIGSTTITVKADKYSCYKEASTTVTINVHSACDEGRHKLGEYATTVAPTCKPGTKQATCSKCGHVAEETIPAVQDHSFGDWTTVQAPSCSAEGSKERTCPTCGTKETEKISKTEHTFNGGATCSACGASNPNYVSPEPPGGESTVQEAT